MRFLLLLLLLLPQDKPKLREGKDLKADFNKSKDRARMLVILAPC